MQRYKKKCLNLQVIRGLFRLLTIICFFCTLFETLVYKPFLLYKIFKMTK